MIEAESAVPEGLSHIGNAVLAHDVEGEAAGAGHDAGVVSDAAFVLVAGDIADIMVAVFDAPMASDGGGPIGLRNYSLPFISHNARLTPTKAADLAAFSLSFGAISSDFDMRQNLCIMVSPNEAIPAQCALRPSSKVNWVGASWGLGRSQLNKSP